MSWSPDGQALVFASEILAAPPGELPGSSLYVVNADGSGLSMVPNTGRVADPAWRPEQETSPYNHVQSQDPGT
jgi:Tol biopolymer transport system component